MNIWYIKEAEENLGILKNILLQVKCFFGILNVKSASNKVICTLPITSNYELTDKKIKRLFKSLKKLLYKSDIVNIAFSSYLSQIELLKNMIYSENINIIDGIELFNYLIYDVVEYISKEKEINLSDLEISILANDNTSVTSENIELICKYMKRLNIITNNIEKFKKLETYLYEELGIMIKVSNNKRKGLSKTNIIINIDFPNELINKYVIPDNCIIVNMYGNININSKRFNGININKYTILMPEEYIINEFDNEVIYESLILKHKRRF